MNIHKTTVAVALSTTTTPPSLLLPNGSVLEFNTGTIICLEGETPPDNCSAAGTDVIGTYFGFHVAGDGTVQPNEKTPVSMNNGIIIGSSQTAGGSHSGVPDGSESPD